MSDFETAKDKVMMGKERKSMIISEEEKANTAHHEAGHTLVAILTPDTDPIHKVSIIPRGMALGITQQLPLDDKYTYSREHIMSMLAVLMGGRAAEEIAMGHMTTGAGNDLQRATDLARKMVCEWGMSDKLGPLTFGKREEQIFLGKEITKHKDYSEKTAEEIDEEVKTIVTERYGYARQLIVDNKEALVRIADALLLKETLDAEEIQALVEGKEINLEVPGGNDDKEKDTEEVSDSMDKPGDMNAAPETSS
jgi:cell division protease FtsH